MGKAKRAMTIAGLLLCACIDLVESETFALDASSWLEDLDRAHMQAGVEQCFLSHQTDAFNDIKGVGWFKMH